MRGAPPFIVSGAALALVLAGCGGSGKTGLSANLRSRGKVGIKIVWPSATTRVIPTLANSIKVTLTPQFASSDDLSKPLVIDTGNGIVQRSFVGRPAGGGTSQLSTIDLAPGDYTISAAAYPDTLSDSSDAPVGTAQAKGSQTLHIESGQTTNFSINMNLTAVDHVDAVVNGTTYALAPNAAATTLPTLSASQGLSIKFQPKAVDGALVLIPVGVGVDSGLSPLVEVGPGLDSHGFSVASSPANGDTVSGGVSVADPNVGTSHVKLRLSDAGQLFDLAIPVLPLGSYTASVYGPLLGSQYRAFDVSWNDASVLGPGFEFVGDRTDINRSYRFLELNNTFGFQYPSNVATRSACVSTGTLYYGQDGTNAVYTYPTVSTRPIPASLVDLAALGNKAYALTTSGVVDLETSVVTPFNADAFTAGMNFATGTTPTFFGLHNGQLFRSSVGGNSLDAGFSNSGTYLDVSASGALVGALDATNGRVDLLSQTGQLFGSVTLPAGNTYSRLAIHVASDGTVSGRVIGKNGSNQFVDVKF